MKQKQYAALALLAWLGVVGWVGSMILAKPQAFAGSMAQADATVAAQIELEIQRVQRTRDALTAMQPTGLSVAATDVIALPPETTTLEDGSVVSANPSAPLDAPPPPRVVSFIISGAGMRSRAMIDGVLVSPGERLADGAIVRRIDARSVRIEDSEGKQHTIALRLPGDAPEATTTGTEGTTP